MSSELKLLEKLQNEKDQENSSTNQRDLEV